MINKDVPSSMESAAWTADVAGRDGLKASLGQVGLARDAQEMSQRCTRDVPELGKKMHNTLGHYLLHRFHGSGAAVKPTTRTSTCVDASLSAGAALGGPGRCSKKCKDDPG